MDSSAPSKVPERWSASEDEMELQGEKSEDSPSKELNFVDNAVVESPSKPLNSSTTSPAELSESRDQLSVPSGYKSASRDQSSSPTDSANQLSTGQPTTPLKPGEVEELVKVDRKKLEELILASTEDHNPAQEFFDQVMQSSGANVLWPTKLKIGAKSKKDPNVKLVGSPRAVNSAKEKILRELDTKSMRITVKMDIPHCEHSHIIGVGGKTVRRISEETSCHIHFPDSNRSAGSSMREKSNQVSINGGVHNVELARVHVRNLLPISIDCHIPLNTQFDPHAPALQQFMSTYSVRIAVRYSSPKATLMNTPTVQCTVEGSQENVEGIKSVVIKLHEYYGSNANPTMFPVALRLSVPSQHKDTNFGQPTLRGITAKTNTEITVDPVVKAGLTKITIEGTVGDVLAARQLLIGCFPLVLMFDVAENHTELDNSDFLQDMMQKLDVYISVKPKFKQRAKSVLVKSLEQNSHCVYEARTMILKYTPQQTSPPPQSGSRPTNNNTNTTTASTPIVITPPLKREAPPLDLSATPLDSGAKPTTPPRNESTTPINDDRQDQNTDESNIGSSYHSSGYDTGPEVVDSTVTKIVSKTMKMAAPERSPSPKTVTICDPAQGKNKSTSKLTSSRRSPSPVRQTTRTVSRHSPPSTRRSPSPSRLQSGMGMELGVRPRNVKDYEKIRVQAKEAVNNQTIDPNVPRYPTHDWCGYHLSSSTTSVELNKGVSPTSNPKHRAPSHMTMDFRRDSQPPCGLRSLTQPSLKKMLATPMEERSLRSVDVSSVQDVSSLLACLKLDDRYLMCFRDHEISEIDDVFLSLDEKDLKEIGISTIGARRSLILAIRDLNKLRKSF